MARPKASKEFEQDPRSSRVARGLRAKSIRQSLRLSRAAFSEKFGVSVHTLQNWEMFKNGGLIERRAHDLVQKLKLAGVQCTFEWLMHGIGPGPTIVDPAWGATALTQASTEPAPSRDAEDSLIAAELNLFRKHYANHEVDMVVSDDGMSPHFLPGDHVAGLSYFGAEIIKANGHDCIVQTEAGEILLRHVKASALPEHYTLSCTNTGTQTVKPFLYDIRLSMAAPVLWMRRKRQS